MDTGVSGYRRHRLCIIFAYQAGKPPRYHWLAEISTQASLTRRFIYGTVNVQRKVVVTWGRSSQLHLELSGLMYSVGWEEYGQVCRSMANDGPLATQSMNYTPRHCSVAVI